MRRLALPVAALCGLALAVVPALAADAVIDARSGPNRFEPSTVTINVGDKVTIRNTLGNGLHNVRWEDRQEAEMDVGPQWTTERRFTTAGTYRFYCEPHRGGGMVGTVNVQGPPATSVPGTTSTQEQPPPPPPTDTGGTVPSPPPPDTTAPAATRTRVLASRRGVRLRFTLSEPAEAIVRVLRRGRRVARRTFDLRAGRVSVRVRRALRPGRYRIRLTLVDAAGNRSSRSLRARVG
jgi:plastocyanin